jgi:hypothetical protein
MQERLGFFIPDCRCLQDKEKRLRRAKAPFFRRKPRLLSRDGQQFGDLFSRRRNLRGFVGCNS